MHRSIYKAGAPASRTHRPSPLAAPWASAHMSDLEGSQDAVAEEEADSLGALPGRASDPAAVCPPASQSSSAASASSSSSSSSSMAPPTLPVKETSRRNKRTSASSFAPIPADDCFDEALEVDLEGEGVWRVYLTPPKTSKRRSAPTAASSLRAAKSGPSTTIAGNPLATSVPDPDLASLQLPHLSSEDDDEDENEHEHEGDDGQTSAKRPGTLMLFHHGAGFSGLSFALTAKEVTRLTDGEVGVLAFDCRGHGRTRHPESKTLPLDMSLSRLTQDVVLLLQKLYPPPASMPTLLLVGHSMGGAVVTSLSNALQSLPTPVNVAGVAVLDVVEGTALAALEGMRGIVMAQPKGFGSIEDAIQWHLDSGVMHNSESARRSVSSLLTPNPTYNKDGTAAAHQRHAEREEAMEELQDETDAHEVDLGSTAESFPYTWRADLLSTSPYWSDWFTGLSSRFLSVRTARLLLLAGTDRLDKALMVGQMQGKYQLTVFPEVGHCLQEDAPERTAKLLVEFWQRNEVTPARMKLLKGGLSGGLKKVGER